MPCRLFYSPLTLHAQTRKCSRAGCRTHAGRPTAARVRLTVWPRLARRLSALESRTSTIGAWGAGTKVTSSDEPPRSSAPTVCTACASAATPDARRENRHGFCTCLCPVPVVRVMSLPFKCGINSLCQTPCSAHSTRCYGRQQDANVVPEWSHGHSCQTVGTVAGSRQCLPRSASGP